MMRARRTHLGLWAVLMLTASLGAVAPLPIQAQENPSATAATAGDQVYLIADEVFLTGDDRLTARGNVEILQGETRLTTAEILYDRASGALTVPGPVTLREADGTTVIADYAELDSELQTGLLRSARVVLDNQVQLAAVQMNRVSPRYAQMYKAVVTSCKICEDGTPPLWQIRARRMVHDKDEKQLYFDHATLRVGDVPILYLPRLRLPDPTLDRATGFLPPAIKTTTLLGTGLKLPYFITLGDHKDLTLTPYVSAETNTLEFRYRQAFVNGDIRLVGAVSEDTLLPGEMRGYLFADGLFHLKNDFKLAFDAELVEDNTYLGQYGYTTKDRLDSQISLTRIKRESYLRAALTHYYTLSTTADNSTLPTFVGEIDYERRFFPKALGGELRLGAEFDSHYRTSDLATDGADADPWADGRDLTRLTATANWSRTETLGFGLQATVQAGVSIDRFDIAQGGTTTLASATEVSPHAALTLRLPLGRRTQTSRQILEPIVQFASVGGQNRFVPNNESLITEFDEGNLLSLSRFVASDRREHGNAAAIGLNWTRDAYSGWSQSLSFGQVIRDTAEPDFTNSSGLQGRFSDVLVAGQIETPNGLNFMARGLFDNGFDTTKIAARAGWTGQDASLGLTYLWLGADPAEDRASTISEWSLDSSYRFAQNWRAAVDYRYDVAQDRSISAGLELTYRNECVDVTFGTTRRFIDVGTLAASTDFSFTVTLRGFTTKSGEDDYVRSCR